MLFLRLGSVLAVFAALVPASVQAQSLKLIPMPREVHAVADQPLSSGVRILCPSCDAEDQFAADDLAGTLRERGLSAISGAGFKIELTRLASHPVAGFSAEMKPEGYVITASGQKVVFAAYVNHVALSPNPDAAQSVAGQALGEIAAAAYDAPLDPTTR